MTMAENAKQNLLGLSRSKMEQFFESLGEKKFRANQVVQWIHQFGVSDFAQMTNISKSLRARLTEVAEIREPEVIYHDISSDGTSKWVMRLDGGNSIETVLIPEAGRATLCVSSQIGCTLDCSFCSTGKQGFNRNLSAHEIIGQVWVALRSFGNWDRTKEKPITNIVMMGMGEPLMNFNNVVDAMNIMMDDFAYCISKRRLTLSTAGVVPAIDKLGDVTDVSLAISLHAPTDDLRNTLVPINKKWPISELLAACRRYLDKLPDRRKITVEYTLIARVNDQPEHARKLAKILDGLPCKVNLIPFNPFPGSGYAKPNSNQVESFKNILANSGLVTTVRSTRGDDIDAACGQLVGRVQDRTRRTGKAIPVAQVI
ncbi:MAG: 23S rRNA (adenine(2503)-C(2))-methyltransferase RlmN [Gammaproteobacteria bacterium]|nr:MAG: 23S rRNA (adenine(2503)-C(2))-methyltransferase RlmN [Gammaproteobacteria bacterium]